MDYKIEKASSGWISSFTSGEMLVCRFKEPGVVLIQTRNPQGFAEWIKDLLPLQSKKIIVILVLMLEVLLMSEFIMGI